MGVSHSLNHIKCPWEPLGSRNHRLFEALANGEVARCTQRWCGLAESHVVLNSDLDVPTPIQFLALCKAGATTTRTKMIITYHSSYNHVITCHHVIHLYNNTNSQKMWMLRFYTPAAPSSLNLTRLSLGSSIHPYRRWSRELRQNLRFNSMYLIWDYDRMRLSDEMTWWCNDCSCHCFFPF